MAVLAAAALLDELMGRNRNIAPNDKPRQLNWEEHEYCKMYLVRFCPHDLFVNTRADLGICPKVHDDEAKSLFQNAPSYKKAPHEEDFLRFCQMMLNEVERKIVKGKQRLALIGRGEPVQLPAGQAQKNDEQIAFLTEKINKLVAEAEQMGIQGNVEQAQGLMKLCDQLKEEREQLRGSNDNMHWQQTADLAASQEKQMEVCEVCGAFLIVGDAQQRIEDHLQGKQHMGYSKLKTAVEEMTKEREKLREKRREDERKDRGRSRDDDRRRDRDRDRDRERDRERDRRRRHEERERIKPRHRSRSPRHYGRPSPSRRRTNDFDNHYSGRGRDSGGRMSSNSSRSKDHREKRYDDERDSRRLDKDKAYNGERESHKSSSRERRRSSSRDRRRSRSKSSRHQDPKQDSKEDPKLDSKMSSYGTDSPGH